MLKFGHVRCTCDGMTKRIAEGWNRRPKPMSHVDQSPVSEFGDPQDVLGEMADISAIASKRTFETESVRYGTSNGNVDCGTEGGGGTAAVETDEKIIVWGRNIRSTHTVERVSVCREMTKDTANTVIQRWKCW
ncbi:unnamed protein product [Strongylus vulgaris]|uniref:Uncharacterized protein n=1 Tax=Strongylus vulgaris TaxID=40348 RepID=A0A3P7LR34_STRVU|nr:unnamed protein product [Strongylus vulgaris]